MADENKDVDNIGKTFEGIKFEKVEDPFSVNVQFKADTNILSLKFVNEKSKRVFRQDFDKESIDKIIEKCKGSGYSGVTYDWRFFRTRKSL